MMCLIQSHYKNSAGQFTVELQGKIPSMMAYFRSCTDLYEPTHAVCTAIVKKHYHEVTMGAIASEITSLTIVYSIVYSDADQRKHQSSASLAFLPDEFPAQMASYAGMFPFDDLIMKQLTYL